MFEINSDSKFKLIMTFVYGIIPAVFIPLAATFILKIIIDCITGESDAKNLLISFFAFAAMNIIFQAVSYKNEMRLAAYSEKWRYTILGNIIRKNLSVSYEDIESYEKRKIFDKAVAGIFYGDMGLSQFLYNIQKMIIALTGIAAFFALAALADPWILAACIFSAAANFIFCVLSKKVSMEENSEYLLATRKARYLSTGKGADLKAAKDMKIFNVASWFTPLIDMLIGDYKSFKNSANKKHFLYNILTYGVFLARDLSVFAILISLYSKGRLTAGDFAFYYSVISGANSWIFQVAQTYGELYSNHLYADEYRKCIEKEEDFGNAKPLENFPEKCAVEFDDVSFSYDDDTEVLRNVDLHIKAGETVAVVGHSGGGKTTLCQLIPRFYDVTSGSITIDGEDIRDVTKRSIRENIGIVQQDVFIFADTILENIRYGRPEATFEEVIEAAKKAEIYDDILDMPDGFDTYVGERGTMLSGGQKQRVSIARIFLKNPKILILDEATSALDTITEERIQRSFDELSVGRTTLVIAHRLATVKNADRIDLIDDGRNAEEGTHGDLLALGGMYARLYNTQKLIGEKRSA